jgi:hypothetical protein
MAQWTLWGCHQLASAMFTKTGELPEEWYVALILDTQPDPFVAGQELDEPFESGYARVAVPNTSEFWGSTLEAVYHNLAEVRFGTATEDWGTINFWALCNAATEGFVYLWGEFEEELFISAGDTPVIPAELLQLEFTEVYQEMAHE